MWASSPPRVPGSAGSFLACATLFSKDVGILCLFNKQNMVKRSIWSNPEREGKREGQGVTNLAHLKPRGWKNQWMEEGAKSPRCGGFAPAGTRNQRRPYFSLPEAEALTDPYEKGRRQFDPDPSALNSKVTPPPACSLNPPPPSATRVVPCLLSRCHSGSPTPL